MSTTSWWRSGLTVALQASPSASRSLAGSDTCLNIRLCATAQNLFHIDPVIDGIDRLDKTCI
tara:strand:+ start:2197 stop:2382 length:186 start_codon:yes stop_codon:yes gene_type:complete